MRHAGPTSSSSVTSSSSRSRARAADARAGPRPSAAGAGPGAQPSASCSSRIVPGSSAVRGAPGDRRGAGLGRVEHAAASRRPSGSRRAARRGRSAGPRKPCGARKRRVMTSVAGGLRATASSVRPQLVGHVAGAAEDAGCRGRSRGWRAGAPRRRSGARGRGGARPGAPARRRWRARPRAPGRRARAAVDGPGPSSKVSAARGAVARAPRQHRAAERRAARREGGRRRRRRPRRAGSPAAAGRAAAEDGGGERDTGAPVRRRGCTAWPFRIGCVMASGSRAGGGRRRRAQPMLPMPLRPPAGPLAHSVGECQAVAGGRL